MERVEIGLNDEERLRFEKMSTSRSCTVRCLQRAQVLLALDRGVLDHQIAEVLKLERTRIWCIRKRYLENGVEAALNDQPRPGRPRDYDDKAEAELVALACSKPPAGQGRWTIGLLTEVARRQSKRLKSLSQGTVRQGLKKTRMAKLTGEYIKS